MRNKILAITTLLLFNILLVIGTFVHTMNDIKVYPSNDDNYVIVESCGQTWACDFIEEK